MNNSSIGKMVFGLFAGVLLLVAVFGTWFTTDTGYNYVVQNTWSGNVSVYSEAGTHLKLPFFTQVYPYKQASTINFSGVSRAGVMVSAPDVGSFTRQQPAAEVAFADTYTGDIPSTFRFRLPGSAEQMLAIHREFGCAAKGQDHDSNGIQWKLCNFQLYSCRFSCCSCHCGPSVSTDC